MNIRLILSQIQKEINVPKTLWNKFGKYYYRNANGILEALKPLANKYKVAVIISDEMVNIGDRYYTKSTATLIETETNTSISSTGFAREAESQKGMDSSQLSGSTSSYARKYALCGLLAIDDGIDSDTTNNGSQQGTPQQKPPLQNKSQGNSKKFTTGIKCQGCGVDINEAVNAYSTKTFNKSLCIPCQQKLKK